MLEKDELLLEGDMSAEAKISRSGERKEDGSECSEARLLERVEVGWLCITEDEAGALSMVLVSLKARELKARGTFGGVAEVEVEVKVAARVGGSVMLEPKEGREVGRAGGE